MPVFSPSSLTETSTAIRETDLFFDMVFKTHTGQHLVYDLSGAGG